VAVVAPHLTAVALLKARNELSSHPIRDPLAMRHRGIVALDVAVRAIDVEEVRDTAHDTVDLTLTSRVGGNAGVLAFERSRWGLA
jgi:hypothetical protein